MPLNTKYYLLQKNIAISAANIDLLHEFLVIIITDIALQKRRIAYIITYSTRKYKSDCSLDCINFDD